MVMVEISVNPRVALADEMVTIAVTGLKKNELFTITSCVASDRGVSFNAYACYTSDADGTLDLSRDASSGGSYVGVEAMGLFWSQQVSDNMERRHGRLIKWDLTTPSIFTFKVYCGHLDEDRIKTADALASNTAERWYMNDGIEKLDLNHGRLRGILFVPKQTGSFPGIIDIRGGSGTLLEYRSSLLACHGFVTLAIAYDGYRGVVKDGKKDPVDIEYFEEAIKYLLNHSKVSGSGIGIIGSSGGGVLGLAISGCIPDVKCVIDINGPPFAIGRSFVHKGRLWEPLPLQMEQVKVADGIHYFIDAVKVPKPEDMQKKILPFAESKADLLFIMSMDDGVIKWDEMGPLLEQTLKKAGKINYKMVRYPGAGHLLEPPYHPLATTEYFSNEYNVPLYFGGSVKPHAKAQENFWLKTVDFLRKNLCSDLKF